MRQQIAFILLFIWLLFLSTFLLNSHLLVEPFMSWFINFYYLSYLIFPVLLIVIKESIFEKALLSFIVGLWVCLMALIFMVLQQAVLSMYGNVFGNSDLMTIALSLFFISWTVAISILCLIIGLVKRLINKQGKRGHTSPAPE